MTIVEYSRFPRDFYAHPDELSTNGLHLNSNTAAKLYTDVDGKRALKFRFICVLFDLGGLELP